MLPVSGVPGLGGRWSGSNAGVSRARPVGTAGAPGQARAIVALMWRCADCDAENGGGYERCKRCKSPRRVASTTDASASSTANADGSTTQPTAWREALDPRTRQVYYWNATSGETAWARPAELGAAPHATGFFGRGAAGSGDVQAAFMRRNALWLQRPARKQSDVDPRRLQRAEGANEYNIWYHRYVGEHWRGSNGGPRELAATRCVPETDVGWTAASRNHAERAYFCIYFARGACNRGFECTFYHYIPTAEDDAAADTIRDVFGRERHTSHRDDMGGVGDFNSSCRTLFVGGVKSSSDVRGALERHFGAWGELENINYIERKAIAFVRYRCRANCEFAREAMVRVSAAVQSNRFTI